MLARTLAIGVVTFACGLPAAEEAKVPRVGFLANTVPIRELVDGTTTHPGPRSVVDGLRALGWVDGKNIRFVWRSAEGDLTRLPALVDELLRERVDVLVGYGPGAWAAVVKTETVPIVLGASAQSGSLTIDGRVRIASLARPGGNITGLTLAGGAELDGKRLELLKQAAPRIARVAFLTRAAPESVFGPSTRAAAQRLGVTLQAFAFEETAAGLEDAFAAMARQRMEAVVVTDMPIANLAATQGIIHGLAERHRMLALHEVLAAADSGGLMAYGHDIDKLYRRVPYFIDRILRGTKPGDIPIEQPTDYELRVNLHAARALGITLPRSLLLQAAKVIE